MSELNFQAGSSNGPERSISAERTAEQAPGRTLLYAIFSDLAASPFDAAPVVAGEQLELSELGLPFATGSFNDLLLEWRTTDREELKRVYSGLFEVGSDGPVVPIREDLHRNQPAGVREDIVRFYEFFGYGLEEKFAWAPDHLSVEFEFMHFLCYHEAQQLEQGGDALSFQLAQIDFAERHLCNWVPELAERIAGQNADGLYTRLFAGLSECLLADMQWQATTIIETS